MALGTRFRSYLAPGLLFLTLTLSLYLSYTMQSHLDKDMTSPTKRLPDAFMESVQATRLNKDGKLASLLTAPRLTHYPKSNTTLVEAPHLVIYRDTDPPWHITALHAKAQDDLATVHLFDDVKIHEAKGPNNYDTTLLTTALTFYPERRFVETNQPITLLQPGSKIEATGMQASLPNGWIKFLSDAKGAYDPKAYETPTP